MLSGMPCRSANGATLILVTSRQVAEDHALIGIVGNSWRDVKTIHLPSFPYTPDSVATFAALSSLPSYSFWNETHRHFLTNTHIRHFTSLAGAVGVFRSSHTSATWAPRPLPPKPGSRVQVRVNSPPAVASGGISNSKGAGGHGLAMSG